MNPVIPAPVPVPLPAPPWLLQLLLVFTFILHVLPMNMLLGGTVLLTISSFLGRTRSRHRELVRHASRALPPVVAFTITLGIAPLLFLQLLYGQLFYTASVLMAWRWLAVVLLLMLGYYGVYWLILQHEELGPSGAWVILVTTLMFLGIMETWVQNINLLQRPADFYAQFLARGVGAYTGMFTSLTLARSAHFLVGAVAVAGLGLAMLARTWRETTPELAAWARRYGVIWFVAGTGVQFFVGLWFLFSLPGEIRGMFLGGDRLATALFLVALVLAVLAMVAAPKSLAAAAVAIFGTISLMAVMRHLVRVAYLRPYFDPRALPVEGQWVVFSIFAVLLVAGLVTVGWMLYQFFRSGAARAPSA